MHNEENMEYYEEEVDQEGSSHLQAGASSTDASGEVDEEDIEDEYGDEEFGGQYRKQQIFQELDFSKHKTKIACTIGPATKEPSQIIELFDSGMTMARFNVSHGTDKTNAKLLRSFAEAKRLRPHCRCATVLDLIGREIRLNPAATGKKPFRIEKADEIKMRCDGFMISSSSECLQMDNMTMLQALQEEDEVRVGDNGEILLEVKETDREYALCKVIEGGLISGGDRVRVPGQYYEKGPVIDPVNDTRALNAFLETGSHSFDFVAVPGIQTGKDVMEVRHTLGEESKVQIIAKVDTMEAVQNFATILKQADAMCIIRSALSIVMDAEKLFIAQRWMIQTANEAAVPIFIQSQLLESMVPASPSGSLSSPVPTRAETQDISQTVLEGADCYILSHETSIGAHPTQATIQLAKAISEAENIYNHDAAYKTMRDRVIEKKAQADAADALCSTAMQIALENNVDMFLTITKTGKVARQLARQRPYQAIVACSIYTQVVNQVHASSRGVIGQKVPAHMQFQTQILIDLVLKVCKEQGYCVPGNKVMIFTPEDEGTLKETVNFKMLEVGDQ